MNTEAKTLADYKNDKQIAEQKVQLEEQKNQLERDRLTRANEDKSTQTNQKNTLLKNYTSKIEHQGNEQISIENQKLITLTELKVQVTRINRQYARKQRPQIREYRNFIGQFQAYKAQEENKKELLRANLLAAQQSQTTAAIAKPRLMIQKLYWSEIEDQNKIALRSQAITQSINQAFRDYEAEITPFQKLMDRFTLQRLTPPTQTLIRLTQILEYSNQRRHYFTRVIQNKFPDIENQVTQIIADRVQNDLNQFEKSRIELGIAAAWGALANELTARKATLYRDLKAKSPVGCGQKLRALHDYYQEILTHQGKCANIDLTQPGPYRAGCAILKSSFSEAKKFFTDTAWFDIDLTLLNAAFTGPQELTALIQKLKEFRAHKDEGLLKSDFMMKVINVHDQLLEEWEMILKKNISLSTSTERGVDWTPFESTDC